MSVPRPPAPAWLVGLLVALCLIVLGVFWLMPPDALILVPIYGSF